jgi:DNA-binding beta-propeller fold protein YncE
VRFRSHSVRAGALRPAIETLESRELLSRAAFPGQIFWYIAPVNQLFEDPTTRVSTVPPTGDANPDGVAYVPEGFARGGALRAGDILVSNFDNSANDPGTGTTIVRVTPSGQQSVFYQGPPGVGLTSALGVLKRGFVLAGYVPSTGGTAMTAQPGGILVLNSRGAVVANISDSSLLDGPWGMTIADSGKTAKVFVSDVLSGAVSRLDVKLSPSGGFQVMRSVQIASGYAHHADSSAFEIGPTGLVFDAKKNTLYVASTADNAIYAIKGAGTARSDLGMGSVVYRDSTVLHGPVGMAMSPDGNLIAAQGDAVDPNPNQSSELVEFTRGGRLIGEYSISDHPGGAFGVAASPTGLQLAAVDDTTNSLIIWDVAPHFFYIYARPESRHDASTGPAPRTLLDQHRGRR